ncbi:hypothetical protein RFI_29945, partial [Reticulomyxa filosa]
MSNQRSIDGNEQVFSSPLCCCPYDADTEVELLEKKRNQFFIGQKLRLTFHWTTKKIIGTIKDNYPDKKEVHVWRDDTGEPGIVDIENKQAWEMFFNGEHLWSLVDELQLEKVRSKRQDEAIAISREELLSWRPIPVATEIGEFVQVRFDKSPVHYYIGRITDFDPVSRLTRVIYGNPGIHGSEWCCLLLLLIFPLSHECAQTENRGTSDKIKKLTIKQRQAMEEAIQKQMLAVPLGVHQPPPFDPYVYRLPSEFVNPEHQPASKRKEHHINKSQPRSNYRYFTRHQL